MSQRYKYALRLIRPQAKQAGQRIACGGHIPGIAIGGILLTHMRAVSWALCGRWVPKALMPYLQGVAGMQGSGIIDATYVEPKLAVIFDLQGKAMVRRCHGQASGRTRDLCTDDHYNC